MSSKRRISRISKRTKKTINTKMTYPIKDYHIIENQKLDISLLNKNNSIYMNDFKYIPNEYIEFLKKCYKINNSKFPYTIINNKFPKDYHNAEFAGKAAEFEVKINEDKDSHKKIKIESFIEDERKVEFEMEHESKIASRLQNA